MRQALDAVAAARAANGARDARHSIAHIELIDAADIPRFGELGWQANMQPFWAHLDEETRDIQLPLIGPDRYDARYAFGDLRRTGARLAIGSDWTVTTADPLQILEVAIRRIFPTQRDDPPWRPDQRLDLDTALAAATLGSAWVSRMETDTGTIEVGKLADLVVLDRDLRTVPTARPADATVQLTFVAGCRRVRAGMSPSDALGADRVEAHSEQRHLRLRVRRPGHRHRGGPGLLRPGAAEVVQAAGGVRVPALGLAAAGGVAGRAVLAVEDVEDEAAADRGHGDPDRGRVGPGPDRGPDGRHPGQGVDAHDPLHAAAQGVGHRRSGLAGGRVEEGPDLDRPLPGARLAADEGQRLVGPGVGRIRLPGDRGDRDRGRRDMLTMATSALLPAAG